MKQKINLGSSPMKTVRNPQEYERQENRAVNYDLKSLNNQLPQL